MRSRPLYDALVTPAQVRRAHQRFAKLITSDAVQRVLTTRCAHPIPIFQLNRERFTYIGAAEVLRARPNPEDWSPADRAIVSHALAFHFARTGKLP